MMIQLVIGKAEQMHSGNKLFASLSSLSAVLAGNWLDLANDFVILIGGLCSIALTSVLAWAAIRKELRETKKAKTEQDIRRNQKTGGSE